MIWKNEHLAGLLPMFLSEHSSADAVTQLNAKYTHGGGWRDFPGFTLITLENGDYALSYPGDPLMPEMARTKLRDETIVLFRFDWVAVIQPTGDYRVARMD